MHSIKQTYAKDFEWIQARETDDIKDYRGEPTGHYALIRINQKKRLIEVGICNAQHVILKGFSGKIARDLWTAIFDFEEQNGLKWFTLRSHVAYLGKELKKAELVLQSKDGRYIQE